MDTTEQTALERLEAEFEARKRKLLRQMELAKCLPTTGKVFKYEAEGGWEADGNTRKPDITARVPLDPYLFHDTFRGCQHVQYRAPREYETPRPVDHSVTRARYLLAVLDSYKDLIPILALKGRYASHMPSSYDWEKHRDYQDSKVLGQGLVELTIGCHVGHGSIDAKMEFYANTAAGPVQVSIDVGYPHHLAPRAVGVKHYGGNGPASSVDRWDRPQTDAVNVWMRGHYDSSKLSCTLEYLFDSVETALAAIQR